jgi:thiol-disulfide isomerase/thioredoxin
MFLALLSTLCCLITANPTLAARDSMVHANESDPGSTVEVKNFLANDKPTLLFIRSLHCPTCKRATPRIMRLSNVNSNIRIVDILIDKKSDTEIGFNSPAGKQFEVTATPTYIIYDKDGKVSASGDKADEQVDNWLKEAHL